MHLTTLPLARTAIRHQRERSREEYERLLSQQIENLRKTAECLPPASRVSVLFFLHRNEVRLAELQQVELRRQAAS